MKETKKISYSLGRIQTDQFAYFEDVLSSFNGTGVIQNDGNITVGGDHKERIITISIVSKFSIENQTILVIKVKTSFQIDSSSWNSFIDDNKVILPRDFVINLESIAISITRGVLAAKTEGTCFSAYMIPLLNMNDIQKEDIIIPNA